MTLQCFTFTGKKTSPPKAGWTLRAALSAVAVASALVAAWPWEGQAADRRQVNRGKYLVTVAGCTDCHTPGHFFGKPDVKRFLGGSEVG